MREWDRVRDVRCDAITSNPNMVREEGEEALRWNQIFEFLESLIDRGERKGSEGDWLDSWSSSQCDMRILELVYDAVVLAMFAICHTEINNVSQSRVASLLWLH